MQQYKIKVKIRGLWIVTALFAESSTHARLLAEYEFGIGKVQMIGSMKIKY